MVIYQYQTDVNDSFSSLNDRRLMEIGKAQVLSLSLEKPRFDPTGTGYSPSRYIAVARTECSLSNPPSPLYAKSESGAAWAAINGAIVEAISLNNNLWRLTIDPAKPLPPIA